MTRKVRPEQVQDTINVAGAVVKMVDATIPLEGSSAKGHDFSAFVESLRDPAVNRMHQAASNSSPPKYKVIRDIATGELRCEDDHYAQRIHGGDKPEKKHTKKMACSLIHPAGGVKYYMSDRDTRLGIIFDIDRVDRKDDKYVFKQNILSFTKSTRSDDLNEIPACYKHYSSLNSLRRSFLEDYAAGKNNFPSHTELLFGFSKEAVIGLLVLKQNSICRLNAIYRAQQLYKLLDINVPIMIDSCKTVQSPASFSGEYTAYQQWLDILNAVAVANSSDPSHLLNSQLCQKLLNELLDFDLLPKFLSEMCPKTITSALDYIKRYCANDIPPFLADIILFVLKRYQPLNDEKRLKFLNEKIEPLFDFCVSIINKNDLVFWQSFYLKLHENCFPLFEQCQLQHIFVKKFFACIPNPIEPLVFSGLNKILEGFNKNIQVKEQEKAVLDNYYRTLIRAAQHTLLFSTTSGEYFRLPTFDAIVYSLYNYDLFGGGLEHYAISLVQTFLKKFEEQFFYKGVNPILDQPQDLKKFLNSLVKLFNFISKHINSSPSEFTLDEDQKNGLLSFVKLLMEQAFSNILAENPPFLASLFRFCCIVFPGNQCYADRLNQLAANVITTSVDIMQSSDDDYTIFQYACASGVKQVVECFIRHLLVQEESKQKYIQALMPGIGWTPLHSAAFKGHEDIVVLLLNTYPSSSVDLNNLNPFKRLVKGVIMHLAQKMDTKENVIQDSIYKQLDDSNPFRQVITELKGSKRKKNTGSAQQQSVAGAFGEYSSGLFPPVAAAAAPPSSQSQHDVAPGQVTGSP